VHDASISVLHVPRTLQPAARTKNNVYIFQPLDRLAFYSSAGASNDFEKNTAFRNNLLVPYQYPRKFGLSANPMMEPAPARSVINAAVPASVIV
jgi:hypothetical protein